VNLIDSNNQSYDVAAEDEYGASALGIETEEVLFVDHSAGYGSGLKVERRREDRVKTYREDGGSIPFRCRRLAEYLNGHSAVLESDN
jgi:hypothetical protein